MSNTDFNNIQPLTPPAVQPEEQVNNSIYDPPVYEPINTLTYTTYYERAKIAPSFDGLTNVIRVVYCCLTATDEFNNKLTAGSDIGLGDPNPSSFTDFDSVTKEQIDDWVKGTNDYKKLEQKVIVGMNSFETNTLVDVNLQL